LTQRQTKATSDPSARFSSAVTVAVTLVPDGNSAAELQAIAHDLHPRAVQAMR
jgi:hypothetical protein